MSVLKELKRFQTDRNLHKKPFDARICTMNIIEEIFEMYGVQDNESRLLANDITDRIEGIAQLAEKGQLQRQGIFFQIPTRDNQVDALCDIQVFAGGDVMKLGYDNKKCLREVGKEINSREGEIIEGKFQKYKTPEAMAKWYKANFSNCKL